MHVVHRTILGVTLGSILCLMLGLATATSATASASSQVIVVRDQTNGAQCQKFREAGASGPQSQTPCPAGTLMGTAIVSQNEAIAKHELYVKLPSRSADVATIRAANKQIEDLLRTVSDQALASSATQKAKAISPLSILCGTSATVGANALISWGTSASIASTVNYYLSTDCSHVYINWAQASRASGSANVYWWKTQYAGGVWYDYDCAHRDPIWGCPNPYVGSWSSTINSSQTAGYWFQFYYCSGAFCQPWDTRQYWNIAILN